MINCNFTGLNAQNESAAQAAAAAAGLLPSMNIQNLAALAAMAQPALSAATQQPSAQLSNAAALLCKSISIFFFLFRKTYSSIFMYHKHLGEFLISIFNFCLSLNEIKYSGNRIVYNLKKKTNAKANIKVKPVCI